MVSGAILREANVRQSVARAFRSVSGAARSGARGAARGAGRAASGAVRGAGRAARGVASEASRLGGVARVASKVVGKKINRVAGKAGGTVVRRYVLNQFAEVDIEINDYSHDFLELLDNELNSRLEEAGGVLADAIRAKIASNSVSRPGEPPGTRSGRLLASVQSNVTNLNLIVAAATEYAKYLEEGTSNMDARPFIASTLEDKSAEVNQIVVGDQIE